MRAKVFELRDRATFVPLLAVDMNPEPAGEVLVGQERYLLRRAGYPCDGKPRVEIARLAGLGQLTWAFMPRLQTIEKYITDNWHRLPSGSVIDVEHILGERAEPKRSERVEHLGG